MKISSQNHKYARITLEIDSMERNYAKLLLCFYTEK